MSGQGQGNMQQFGQGGGMNNGQCNQVAGLANELLKIKDLTTQLEMRTSQLVNSSSGGSLNEKDVVYLVLTLINGMVDWASEFVMSNASAGGGASSGQLQ